MARAPGNLPQSSDDWLRGHANDDGFPRLVRPRAGGPTPTDLDAHRARLANHYRDANPDDTRRFVVADDVVRDILDRQREPHEILLDDVRQGRIQLTAPDPAHDARQQDRAWRQQLRDGYNQLHPEDGRRLTIRAGTLNQARSAAGQNPHARDLQQHANRNAGLAGNAAAQAAQAAFEAARAHAPAPAARVQPERQPQLSADETEAFLRANERNADFPAPQIDNYYRPTPQERADYGRQLNDYFRQQAGGDQILRLNNAVMQSHLGRQAAHDNVPIDVSGGHLVATNERSRRFQTAHMENWSNVAQGQPPGNTRDRFLTAYHETREAHGISTIPPIGGIGIFNQDGMAHGAAQPQQHDGAHGQAEADGDGSHHMGRSWHTPDVDLVNWGGASTFSFQTLPHVPDSPMADRVAAESPARLIEIENMDVLDELGPAELSEPEPMSPERPDSYDGSGMNKDLTGKSLVEQPQRESGATGQANDAAASAGLAEDDDRKPAAADREQRDGHSSSSSSSSSRSSSSSSMSSSSTSDSSSAGSRQDRPDAMERDGMSEAGDDWSTSADSAMGSQDGAKAEERRREQEREGDYSSAGSRQHRPDAMERDEEHASQRDGMSEAGDEGSAADDRSMGSRAGDVGSDVEPDGLSYASDDGSVASYHSAGTLEVAGGERERDGSFIARQEQGFAEASREAEQELRQLSEAARPPEHATARDATAQRDSAAAKRVRNDAGAEADHRPGKVRRLNASPAGDVGRQEPVAAVASQDRASDAGWETDANDDFALLEETQTQAAYDSDYVPSQDVRSTDSRSI